MKNSNEMIAELGKFITEQYNFVNGINESVSIRNKKLNAKFLEFAGWGGGDLPQVKAFLKAGFDPSFDNNIALRQAILNGNSNIVHTLLEDPRVDPYEDNSVALQIAIDCGFRDIIRMLIIDKNPRNKPGTHQRVLRKNRETLEELGVYSVDFNG